MLLLTFGFASGSVCRGIPAELLVGNTDSTVNMLKRKDRGNTWFDLAVTMLIHLRESFYCGPQTHSLNHSVVTFYRS